MRVKTNDLVEVRPTKESLQMMTSGGSISGTIWRSHEIQAYSGLLLKRPVLDLGCGDGRFTKLLFKQPLEIGLDISKDAIEQCKKKKWHNKYIIAPGNKTTLSANSVNSIFSNSVFEHINNLDTVLKEAYRILKPGGQFVFTTHAPDSKKFVVSSFLKALGLVNFALSYEQFFTRMLQLNTLWNRKQWKSKLAENGFQVKKIRGTTPARSTLLYEIFMPLTLLQNRIPLLKSSALTSIVLKIIKPNLLSGGEKNFLIKAVKVR